MIAKFIRLVIMPLFTVAVAMLVMGEGRYRPGYLEDGAVIIGRDADGNYIGSDDCRGIYECGRSICEVSNFVNISLIKVMLFSDQGDCEPNYQLTAEEIFVIVVISIFAGLAVVSSAVLYFSERLYALLSTIFFQISARGVIMVIAAVKERSQIGIYYGIVTDLAFSLYLIMDMILYIAYASEFVEQE